ncbi:lipase family protein [Serratia microhaemolytica]|uniref:lipase family protein n=1 Tax=Serratia microhaemolytica TaxID=2675110 RepID=UPI000FDF370C|nr:lipase family protein [Serratia microhaemolytica]
MTTNENTPRKRPPTHYSCDLLRHWVEIELLDEQGQPITNMPYQLRDPNGVTRHGRSDFNGIIREEKLMAIPAYITLGAQALVEEMAQRPLRVQRGEAGSMVKPAAEAAGYRYHYLRVGELCDSRPNIANWPETDPLPEYHFPCTLGRGLRLNPMSQRHVVEICPFRAWSLVLHHTAEYSLVNAHNLALMSILSYANEKYNDIGQKEGSVQHFFHQQMLDLSRLPYQVNDKRCQPLVKDVPFADRYTDVAFMDTNLGEAPRGDSQLFFAANQQELIIAWRGTASFQDAVTDATYKPIDMTCDIAVPCSNIVKQGRAHQGFLEAFQVVDNSEDDDIVKALRNLNRLLEKEKSLYIAGHSLGGALALLHAAKLRQYNPLLYTYGMPRTLTLSSMAELATIPHYRHINENDAVPSVPPERELDSLFYKLWGPLGNLFGYTWSVVKAVLPLGSEVFCHHGEVVHFYQARSVQQWFDQRNPRAQTKRRQYLPNSAKLFLVPQLGTAAHQQAGEDQRQLMQQLDEHSKQEWFPQYGNPTLKDALTGKDHPSGQYADYIAARLRELLAPASGHGYQPQIAAFAAQLQQYQHEIPLAEQNRDKLFLALDRQLAHSLVITQSLPEGEVIMQRFYQQGESS